jgi:hypothetical protein
MTECEILIDTNQMLHFRRIDEIDWCSLTQCDRCAIVITPILLRELEHNKIFNSSALLRKRASRAIEYLVELVEQPDPIMLRPNVSLDFAETEPGIDFTAHGLSRDVHDDHHIAAAIERHQESGRRTLIASRDGGMALKLRSRPIEILRLPEDLALEAEVDPDQEELRKLRHENARLKARQPKLRLTFADGTTKFEIRSRDSIDLNPRSLSDTIGKFPSLPMPPARGAPDKSLAGIGSSARFAFLAKPEEVQKYNDALQAYYRDYEAYLRELDNWADLARLTAPVGLTLHNDGTATATDIQVIVTVPKNALVFTVGQWIGEPEEPRPPRQPGVLPLLGGYDPDAQELSIPDYLLPRVNRFPAIDLREERGHVDDNNQVVEFSAKSLKQKCDLAFDQILLTRARTLSGKGIELNVRITLHEGEPVHQKLALTFCD